MSSVANYTRAAARPLARLVVISLVTKPTGTGCGSVCTYVVRGVATRDHSYMGSMPCSIFCPWTCSVCVLFCSAVMMPYQRLHTYIHAYMHTDTACVQDFNVGLLRFTPIIPTSQWTSDGHPIQMQCLVSVMVCLACECNQQVWKSGATPPSPPTRDSPT